MRQYRYDKLDGAYFRQPAEKSRENGAMKFSTYTRDLVRRAAILMLVPVCSAGCAAQQFEITAAIAQYRAAETCCHSLAEIRFGQLSSAPDTAIIIDSR